MEHRWNEIDRGKLKYSGEKPVPVPLCRPQILHGLTRVRTRASAVRDRLLTALATAWPKTTPLFNYIMDYGLPDSPMVRVLFEAHKHRTK
jgi:hypothetical protein